MSTSEVMGNSDRCLVCGERNWIAVREGSDLWLTLWVRRAMGGDVYVFWPRADRNALDPRRVGQSQFLAGPVG